MPHEYNTKSRQVFNMQTIPQMKDSSMDSNLVSEAMITK